MLCAFILCHCSLGVGKGIACRNSHTRMPQSSKVFLREPGLYLPHRTNLRSIILIQWQTQSLSGNFRHLYTRQELATQIAVLHSGLEERWVECIPIPSIWVPRSECRRGRTRISRSNVCWLVTYLWFLWRLLLIHSRIMHLCYKPNVFRVLGSS